MAAVRSFAAVLLIVLASILTAQNASTGQVVITVVDPPGAPIPEAHIGIIWLPVAALNDGDWLNYALHATEQASTRSNASGEATIHLAKGDYAIAIAANGFKRYFQRIEIRDESSQAIRATLPIATYSGPVEVMPMPIEIPVEPVYLNIFIPLEPLQTITVTGARARRRWLRL